MGKGARSKIKRRWRALRRGYVDDLIEKPKLQNLNQKLQATIVGVEHRTAEPKNAFLHPNDPAAVFPKSKPGRIVDLRSTSIPGAGLQYAGAYRKKKKNSEGFEVVDDGEWVDDNNDGKEQSEEEGAMKVEKERPKIAKFERKRKQCKRSKNLIVF